MGGKLQDPHLLRKTKCIRLPVYLIEKLNEVDNQGELIEKLLVDYFKKNEKN